ncbi:MAG: permease [Candidatus Humimicrobiaceae bacterium]
MKAVSTLTYSLKEMALVLPPIFILLGLLDVWISKEKMMKYVGKDSGIKGIIIVFIIGSVAAGPLYAAFPVAAVLMKKGAKFSNILIFIGAWSTTKIPMFLFEMSSMGTKFAVTRLLIDIPGIIIIAYAIYLIIPKKEREKIYRLDARNPDTV